MSKIEQGTGDPFPRSELPLTFERPACSISHSDFRRIPDSSTTSSIRILKLRPRLLGRRHGKGIENCAVKAYFRS